MDIYAGDWRKAELSGTFPANFVAETESTQLVVVGRGLRLPNANKAFYRVVAVDSQGERSWSSEYAEAPRPFIYSQPETAATVGQEYRYQISTIRSLGDLSLRTVTRDQVVDFWPPEEVDQILAGPEWHRQVANFWDVQNPRYTIRKGPSWLSIDPTSGLLKGTPDHPGRVHVVISVLLEREIEELDLEAQIWGLRQVTGTATEKMGPTTQEFVIEIKE
jgi:hypothetical protein